MHLDVGVVLSGHLLSRELGRGGMARVFLASPAQGGAAVAIKVALDPRLVEALRAEGATLRRLRSPRFVRVLEERLDADPPHLILEHCPGGDLGEACAAAPEGRLAPERVMALAIDVLEAMAFAHDEGVVHGDLKPENVLLDGEGRAKVADLGLSRAARRSLLMAGVEGSLATDDASHVRGTHDYLAPEVRRGGAITRASDVFALGVTLYELLVGTRPHGMFRPPSEVLGPAAAVPPALDRVIARALSPEPHERHADANAMLVDLSLGAASAEPAPPPSTARGHTDALRRRVVDAQRDADSSQLLTAGLALVPPACVAVAIGERPTVIAAGVAFLALWAVAMWRLGRST